MIKGNGYHFNGSTYTAYYNGKVIGEFATRNQAWYAIGRKQWSR